MKKFLPLIVVFLISVVPSTYSQSCLPEGISFTTQAEIDSFPVLYPKCTEIQGSVSITNPFSSDINNLNGLSSLTSIGGDLNIEAGPLLRNLSGLDSLTSIGGHLIIGSYYSTKFGTLNGLENVQTIGGDLRIADNPKLVSLNGLKNLVSIGGDLRIERNTALYSLAGLEKLSLESIKNITIAENYNLADCGFEGLCAYLADPEGVINIYDNRTGCNGPEDVAEDCGINPPCLPHGNYYLCKQDQIDNFMFNYSGCAELNGDLTIKGTAITSLGGLHGITSVSGNLVIKHTILENLEGLNNLVSIGGSFIFGDNKALASLSGLGNLESITGGFKTHVYRDLPGPPPGGENGNGSLVNFSGLENLRFIGGDLLISYNGSLSSLSGLENLTPGSVSNLTITHNGSLTSCEAESICQYLVNPKGSVNIYNNADGCDSPSEVANSCGFTLPCLPFGNYYFLKQSDIDHFPSDYPGCNDIKGDFHISGTPWPYPGQITNLYGLNHVTSIGGDIDITAEGLTDLSGLNNLDSVGGSVRIASPTIDSLAGLDNLETIGGDLKIDNNYILSDLTGLSNLKSIGGELEIRSNYSLVSLAGLDNINPNSIIHLTITDNNSLTVCDIKSICDYLASPGGTIYIAYNATGCENQEELEGKCGTSVEEITTLCDMQIHPNPCSTQITIQIDLKRSDEVTIKIYNILGEEVATRSLGKIFKGEHTLTMDTGHLPNGLYLLLLSSGGETVLGKMMVSH